MSEILAYDCDGNEIEEFRVLRFPFSADIDNWNEEPNIDPRFYCVIKGSDNKPYLVSIYENYNSDAIRNYERIETTKPIPIKIKSINEASNYEVAFDGITQMAWYYDRDKSKLREKLDNYNKRRNMGDTIPAKVVREIIADILIERSNAIMQACDELSEQSIKATGVVNQYALEVGVESCGTRVLADDVISGEITIEEAIKEILTQEEVKEAKARCLEYVAEKQKDEVER